MKIFSSAFLGLFLISISVISPVRAQQPPPALQPAAPPATQPAPPPAGQTAPPDQPAPADQTRLGIRPAPPPLPKIPDVRQPGETGYWIGIDAWFPTQSPIIDKGHKATFTDPTLSTLEGQPKFADGAEIGLTLGLHNALRLSYLDTRATGSFTNSANIQLFSQTYTAGTYITTDYRLQHAKLEFDYLTWPYPVGSRKFRLRTIWAVQYTTIRAGVDAPFLPTTDSSGNPILDSSGNPITYADSGSRWFISPMLGLGVAEYGSRRFRLEASATGFAIPHHNNIWDADASANIRFGHLELRVGGMALHFQTTTKSDFYMKGTMGAAFVGLRYYSQ